MAEKTGRKTGLGREELATGFRPVAGSCLRRLTLANATPVARTRHGQWGRWQVADLFYRDHGFKIFEFGWADARDFHDLIYFTEYAVQIPVVEDGLGQARSDARKRL